MTDITRIFLTIATGAALAWVPAHSDAAIRQGPEGVLPHSPAPIDSVVVSWSPERPVAGEVVTISVSTTGTDSLSAAFGTLAGERLHFLPAGEGRLQALGGIPIDAPARMTVPLEVKLGSGRADTVRSEIVIGRGVYRLEKLTVAPAFGSPPDAATAARIARDQARAAEVSRAAHLTPRLWEGGFALPRDSRITSGFGHGREFNGNVQSRHMGVDFAGAPGTPVLAPNRGVVALVDDFHLAGNVVYLDHGAGLITGYFHLSAATVAVGDTVKKGQQIGRVGQTGRVTGPHLHWVARYGRVTVNPLTLPGIVVREVQGGVRQD